MQTMELSKEEMSVVYDMRAKKTEEKLKNTNNVSYERKQDKIYIHYMDEDGGDNWNRSDTIESNLLFEILTELQRKNNGNT